MDKTDLLYAPYAEDYIWTMNPYMNRISPTAKVPVPSWYQHVGWYVQIDQDKHYIYMEDELQDLVNHNTSYNKIYHEFDKTFYGLKYFCPAPQVL